MKRITRLSTKRNATVVAEANATTPKKLKSKLKKSSSVQQVQNNPNDSSSESDIENYLKAPNEIDLNSSFFQNEKTETSKSFAEFEDKFLAGVNRLSDSDSEPENNEPAPTTYKLNFQQLHDYTNKLEEAKKVVAKYEANKKIKQRRNKQASQNKDDISNILALGETKIQSSHELQVSLHSSEFESFSESEKEDWEEVEEGKVTETKDHMPKDGIQITLELPDVMRKKKGIDLVASMKRRLNKLRKENQVLVHKVHLLCWLAHGNYVNKILNSEGLLALSLSLIPSQHCYPSGRIDLTYLEQIVKWYKTAIPNVEKCVTKGWSLEKLLKLQINRKQAYNKKMLVFIFICILRSLGIQCRLVLSFQVTPLRPPSEELHSLSINDKAQSSNVKKETQNVKNHTKQSSSSLKSKETNVKQNKSEKNLKTQHENIKNKIAKPNLKKLSSTSEKKESHANSEIIKKDKSKIAINQIDKMTNSSQSKTRTGQHDKPNKQKTKPNLQKLCDKSPANKESKSKTDSKKSKTSKKLKLKTQEIKENNKTANVPQLDGANDSNGESESTKKLSKPNMKNLLQMKPNPCTKSHQRRLKSQPNYTETTSDDDFETRSKIISPNVKKSINLSKLKTTNKAIDVRNDIISIMKHRIAQEKTVAATKLVKKRRSRTQSDDDSDYAPEAIQKKQHDSDDELATTQVKVKQRIKVQSSNDEIKKKKGVDLWVEVFMEAEGKWISADVCKGQVHCVHELYSRASHPVTYIVAWNNNNSVKDITQRYCPNWNTTTRKLRIDKKWWEASLKPFKGKKTAYDKEEDEELARLQLEKPLPNSIAEYKDHPLYVLKRHLLKFQAIYPPDAVTLGFVKNEPVYSRDCVYVLHSREIWMKEAKVVKLGEKPYKIVKARPKYDRLSGKVISDLPLEVFGIWQVEDYVPPTAENGIVPKNAYGNVELFKACMLPKGTVHLKLPGLNKIARKMNIDCVPAVVGFDFHSGWNHPTYDGFVVCEEHQDSLIAAWYMEQDEQEKREQEKIEKRVYGNWKKLIKGLLIRERLKARYDFGGPSQTENDKKKRKSKDAKSVIKKRRICSDSESDD